MEGQTAGAGIVVRTIESTVRDLLVAVRQLAATPAFTISAVLTLALGIGANTGIFSILNGFLRPLPVPDAAQIVVLAADVPSDESGVRYRVSYPALVDYREQMDVSDIFGFDTRLGSLATDAAPSPFLYHYVTGNFFSALRLAPAAGRLLYPGEGERPGAEPVLVLGHGFWIRRFGGNPAVVGTVVRIDGQAVRIVGVAPAGFRGLFAGADVDGYVPLATVRFAQAADRPFSDRTFYYLTMAGRLKRGVSLATAQSAASTVARRLSAQYPASEGGTGVRVMPEPNARPMPIRFFSVILPVIQWLVLGLATLVLIVACLNVANLLLVRASVRQREMAVRAALGASRLRLMRLMLVESFLLAVTGTVVGLLVGRAAAMTLLGSLHLATDLTIGIDFRFDWRIFAYAVGIAVMTSVAVGLLPAIRTSAVDLGSVLHDGGRGGTCGGRRHRLRHALVVVQVAGSLVLLLIAGVFVQSLRRAERVDLGFEPQHVLTMRLHRGVQDSTTGRTSALFDQIGRRVREIPGVEDAAFSSIIPLTFGFNACTIEKEGTEVAEEHLRQAVSYNVVGADYFSTLRLAISRGRAFHAHDRPDTARVAIVNETLAARLWPGQDPIGKRLNVSCAGEGPPAEIVGVASDSKYIAVFERPLPYLYLPIDQLQPGTRMLQIRSRMNAGELAARVESEVRRLGGDVQVSEVRPMTAAIAGGLGYTLFRFGAAQAAAMGVLGLALAVVGLYGVVSYGANQRIREIGIRLALGATRTDIRKLVLGQGARLVGVGAIVGLALGVAATSLLARVFVLLETFDSLTMTLVTIALVYIALVACYLPARRAMRIEPVTALRRE